MALSVFFRISILFAFSTHMYASPITTDAQDCVRVSAPGNGTVLTVYSLSYQLLAIFTCNRGYAAVGETVLSCVDGQWDKTPPLCASVHHCHLKAGGSQHGDLDVSLLKCGKLNPPRFGSMDIVIQADRQSEIANFDCVPGYYVSGSTALHCERGEWDGQEPECKPIDCGEPEAPINGTVEFEDTHYRARAHYKCEGCYQLMGYESRSCKRSGFWSKTTPECVPMDQIACPLPAIPGGGFISNERSLEVSGILCGQTIRIRCFSGYRLIGASTATCNPDGTYSWYGVPPRCRRLRWTR